MAGEILPSSPYFIHSNENPSLKFVDPPLNQDNYNSWSRAMRLALNTKEKLGFVDGTIPVPNNARDTAIWLNTARDIWLNLKTRYSQGDAFRLSDLMEEFYAIRQGAVDVNQYFTNLKIVWDEIQVLKPTPNCDCEPLCNPNCKTLKAVQSHIATDYVIKFVKGLYESLGQVRSQILMMKPLPNIDDAFSLVLQFERQQRSVVSQLQGGISSFNPNIVNAASVNVGSRVSKQLAV